MAAVLQGKVVVDFQDKGKTVEVDVSLQDKVKKVNEYIRQRTGIPVEDQTLLLKGKPLHGKKRLSDFGIGKDVLHLVLKVECSDEEVDMTVISYNDNRHYPIRAKKRSTPVNKVMKMLEAQSGVPPAKQILTLNGKRVEPGKKLGEYRVKTGSLIHMVDFCEGG
ncbi:ubiquitin D [Latimeria chalumnae]|uniref:Ubiquitin D n=1 Tax=Latimeria chalumnae TaxID=7897 RepID=M3XIH6_LATCH|nr:PREDICTED: ubiquitin D [Latimeria chalumnae]|eukprot:XP_006012591.1 PREDICTED: ubiquitin D [Latimeria chalumnae]